jgi:hypothetical protein
MKKAYCIIPNIKDADQLGLNFDFDLSLKGSDDSMLQ